MLEFKKKKEGLVNIVVFLCKWGSSRNCKGYGILI